MAIKHKVRGSLKKQTKGDFLNIKIKLLVTFLILSDQTILLNLKINHDKFHILYINHFNIFKLTSAL